jgi:hypothetical protein
MKAKRSKEDERIVCMACILRAPPVAGHDEDMSVESEYPVV